ncbi:MAG TPA: preprotein translocase subunit SecG [Syntrophobacteraceae bacterium]|nr:preprotein translocase subunit SecG [Syntrophobacteraceae bacterium]
MYTFTVFIHISACVALILIVLLQTGRGAEIGAAFGGASNTLFGGSGGSTFLSKLTTAAAIVFMLTCLGLTLLSSAPKTKSIMENVRVEVPQGPALPEAKPVAPSAEQPQPAQSVPATGSEAAVPQSTPAQPAEPAAVEQPAKQEETTPPAEKAPAQKPDKAPAKGAKKP